jgi:DNA-3-methyladenine glycosylase II
VQAVAPEKISAESLGQLDANGLRPLGISPQKARYLVDLTRKTAEGTLQLTTLGRLDDENVIEHLIQVQGIGRWTAQMFLIFGLGRLNVLPHGDLGIQTAIRREYGLRSNPKPRKIDQVAGSWQPYCSIACWYLWQSLQNNKPKPG